MEKKTIRTDNFNWESRFDLYDYFQERYGLGKKEVDAEIQRVMAIFRPRKGQSIKTQELWQKVGNDLESSLKYIDNGNTGDQEALFEAKEDKAAQELDKKEEQSTQSTTIELPPQPVIAAPKAVSEEISIDKKETAADDDVAYLDVIK